MWRVVGAERHDCVRCDAHFCGVFLLLGEHGVRRPFPHFGRHHPAARAALERASCLIEQGRWQHRMNTENEQWRDVGVKQMHYAKHSTRYSQC